jgi:hypothetical protein
MTDENVRQVWSEDELDRALAVLHSEVDTDRERLATARIELVRAAGGAGGAERAAPPRRRHWGRWAAAAAVVAALVAGALVIQTVQFGDQPPAASAAAAALNSAADKIGASDPPVAPGQYRYIATHAWWMATIVLGEQGGYSYLEENLLETWVPADQKQEWLWRRDVTGARKWVRGTEEQAKAAGVPVGEGGMEGEWKARCGDWFGQAALRYPRWLAEADPGVARRPAPRARAALRAARRGRAGQLARTYRATCLRRRCVAQRAGAGRRPRRALPGAGQAARPGDHRPARQPGRPGRHRLRHVRRHQPARDHHRPGHR